MLGPTTPGAMALLRVQAEAMMTDRLQVDETAQTVRGLVQTDNAVTVTDSGGLTAYHQLADILVPLSAELPARPREFTVAESANGDAIGITFYVISHAVDTGAPYRRYKCRTREWAPE